MSDQLHPQTIRQSAYVAPQGTNGQASYSGSDPVDPKLGTTLVDGTIDKKNGQLPLAKEVLVQSPALFLALNAGRDIFELQNPHGEIPTSAKLKLP